MADWSLLPKDLLELINDRFETCFETVHLRSVCSLWRSAVSPPSYSHGFGVNSLLPIFSDNSRFGGDKHCILQKIPMFLFRYQTPFGVDSLIVGISESNSCKHKLLSSLPGFGFISEHGKVLNTLTTQIIPLDHNYLVNYYATTTVRYRTLRRSFLEKVAFLPLDGREFAIVAGVFDDLMMYRSREESWIKIEGRFRSFQDMVSFKGKFYVVDRSGRGRVFVIEPSSEVSEIQSVTETHECFWETLVVSEDDDELLMVQRFTPVKYIDDHIHTWFRLFRLVEEEDKRRWVRVTDLEDRVVFLGFNWSFCYSAKKIPGMKGNCVMFIRPNTIRDRILVFDLGTRKTTKAITECSMGLLGETKESLLSCGIVTTSNPAISFYDLFTIN